MKPALFITCFNDTLFPETGQAIVRLFDRLGYPLDFPLEQTCCGQMHFNTGYQREVVPLVRRFVQAFEPYDVIVSPSASCVGMVREYYTRVAELSGDGGLAAMVANIVGRVREFSEFLVDDLHLEDVGAYFPHRVTYHPTCHSLRLLHVGEAPLKLLRATRGIDLITLPAADECCGFGGTFALKNAEVSRSMLSDKCRHVIGTGAEVCTAVDNSCLMHIEGGLHRQRAGIRTMHLAQILAGTDRSP